jgi:hypothetical protein
MSRRPKAKVGETRRAGWVGEAEYGVVAITGRDKAHCAKPCPQCPWRADLPTGTFPAEAYRISASTAYDMSARIFACHMAGKDRPRTCAGYLLRGADHSLAIRMQMIRGEYDPRSVSDGGLPLYHDYRAMAEANGVDPDDPVLAPCRGVDS